MKKALLLVSLPLLLAACNTTSHQQGGNSKLTDPFQTHSGLVNPSADNGNVRQPNTLAHGDTPENALDWAGVYQGVYPCADCEGIQISLTLNQNYRYVLVEQYLKNGQVSAPRTSTGEFRFDGNALSYIHLDGNADKRVFFIGEGYAEARDRHSGDKLSNQLNYTLRQSSKL